MFCDCLYVMRSKICQMSCRNVEEWRRWSLKKFLRDSVYLQFNKVDAFSSKDKTSFMENVFLTILLVIKN